MSMDKKSEKNQKQKSMDQEKSIMKELESKMTSKKWNHISSDLNDSMKSWENLESTLKDKKSVEEIKLQEMKELIQHIQNQLQDFK